MEQNREYMVDGEAVTSPEVPIILGGNEVALTWHNTLMRYFGVGEGQNDFVVYLPDDKEFIVFRVDEETKKRLERLRFPFSWDPILDEDAQECLTECIMAEAEQESLPES
jgi:hypothetical protein